MKLHLTACAVALFAAVAPALAQMKPPVPISPSAFASAPIGSRVQIAVRVDRRVRTELRAELLERETDARYRATGKHVTLFAPVATPVVMGTPADVAPGAVVVVTGVVTGKKRADAKQLLVLTQYVTVR